ncbi:hypothetical protein [Pontibacter oryzae]|uniref:DUF2490 domain-containing protein n=1 Tax=Pontibacter oryzae TaxID=2304593 RepID=A0A399SLR3_9BACT|nr:hypothetical protein [Pontibacter oryzae]RIJ43182.1 hypothetical protein D1627_01150 [Pontibacter oryzae]
MRKVKLLSVLVCILAAGSAVGQELHSSLQIRNSHLWRGLEVATGLVYTGDIKVSYKGFYGGFWSGGDASGSYKEFNNFIGYKKERLVLELWDIYNFSPEATYNNKEFFNYNPQETGRFWDMRSNYTLSTQLPLTLSWNTVVFGRDKTAETRENKYSTFVSAEYPLYKKQGLEVKGRVGYSFALNQGENEKANFFARDAGISEVSFILAKDLDVKGYKIPLGIWGMWNPVNENAFLQFSVQAYSF